jgi:DNA polymerase III alpha subunit (gram-positive type)
MVGQNPAFDYGFLKAFFERNGNKFLHAYIRYHMIDLVGLTAAFKLAGRIDVSDMKLSTVAKALNIDHSAHNAKGDVDATKKIFKKYIEVLKGGSNGMV